MPEPVIIDFEADASDLLNEANKVNAALNKTDAAVKDAGASHGVLSQNVKKSSMSWADLSGAVNVAETALRIAGQAYNATVGEAQAYDQEIKGIMASTGGSADSTSRLVQVLDDAGVEFTTVTMAMKEMSKDGTAPSIDELARLSDEFLKIQDPAEKGQFLLDKFGKSGLSMARAMELGGPAIMQMNEGMEGGLILTEESIAASEEYRKNVDELSDAWKGFKVELGNAVIPVINETIQQGKDWQATYDELAATTENVSHRTLVYMTNLQMEKEAAYEAKDAVNAHADALDNTLTPALDSSVQSLEEQAEAMKATSDANKEMLSLVGQMQSAEESYQSKKLALAEERAGIAADDLAALDENTAKTQENEAAHDMANKTIILGLLERKMTQDGVLDDSELNWLLAKGQAWGIYSATVVSDSQKAIAEANKITEAINTIPSERTFTMSVLVQGADAVGGLGSGFGDWGSSSATKQHAAGGSFLIPSSYGNEGFRMGNGDTASAGETVTITPKGQSPDNSALIAAIMATRIDYSELSRNIVQAVLVSAK